MYVVVRCGVVEEIEVIVVREFRPESPIREGGWGNRRISEET